MKTRPLIGIFFAAATAFAAAQPLPLPYSNEDAKKFTIGMSRNEVEAIAGEGLSLKVFDNPRRYFGILKVRGVSAANGVFDSSGKLIEIKIRLSPGTSRADALDALGSLSALVEKDQASSEYRSYVKAYFDVEFKWVCRMQNVSVKLISFRRSVQSDGLYEQYWVIREDSACGQVRR